MAGADTHTRAVPPGGAVPADSAALARGRCRSAAREAVPAGGVSVVTLLAAAAAAAAAPGRG